MKRLTDGERDILREMEADARDGDLDDLMESADCLEDVLDALFDDAEQGDQP